MSDLPLFIDPFLLFNSSNPAYQLLHENIIKYLEFLRDQSTTGEPDLRGPRFLSHSLCEL